MTDRTLRTLVAVMLGALVVVVVLILLVLAGRNDAPSASPSPTATSRSSSAASGSPAAGASDAALRLEEHAVVAATRAHANRLANADEANLVRTARAAHEQLEAIRALDLDTLPPKLAQIAELRLRHPSASLRELAAKARPPITKAGAHRRLRAVVNFADKHDVHDL